MTTVEEFVYTCLGLLIGFVCGMMWGVHKGQQWTDSVAVKESEQRVREHTVGHPMNLP